VVYCGRLAHDISIVPVQPLRELKVSVTAPGEPAEAVTVVLDAETTKLEGSLGREAVIVELASQYGAGLTGVSGRVTGVVGLTSVTVTVVPVEVDGR
jgi:hypothetical protein